MERRSFFGERKKDIPRQPVSSPKRESGAIMNRLLSISLTLVFSVPVTSCFAQITPSFGGGVPPVSTSSTNVSVGFQSSGFGGGSSRRRGSGYGGTSPVEWGEYEILHQQALNLGIQNRAKYVEQNRSFHAQAAADRDALKARRADYNYRTEMRHLRDEPDLPNLSSGAALNFLMKQLGPDLKTIDFAKVKLSAEELQSVRLETKTRISSAELASIEFTEGRVNWPEELQLSEFRSHREVIEQGILKLQTLTGSHHEFQTQLKRVQKEILRLRADAGRILRVEKEDEVGANASRTYLHHLEYQLTQLVTNDRRRDLNDVLHPQVQTAAELMQHIEQHDLQFAACDDVTAPAYRKLHNKLADVHRELHGINGLQAAN
jgi:hypothetical protein